MSESEAHLRIAAARVVRRFQRALDYLQRGELHLCALYALRDHLTEENHEELLREASGKSTDAVRRMLAARFPRPDVPARVEPVVPQIELSVAVPDMTASTPSTSALGTIPMPTCEPRPRIEPLSSTRYRVELTVSVETQEKLERIRDLMRHRNPTGDLETIVDASLDLLLVKLEKERLGKITRPRKATTATTARAPATPSASSASPTSPASRALSGPPASTMNRAAIGTRAGARVGTAPNASADVNAGMPVSKGGGRVETTRPGLAAAEKIARRYISRDVRRQVFARDGERCTFVDAAGNRCSARGHLELDHVRAKARGGRRRAGESQDSLQVAQPAACRAGSRAS